MKKLLSLLLAITLLVSFSTSAMAANREARQPDVFVNDTLVEFADQCAYITDEGRTLVPARGVFEAMDCKVDWDAENYVVTVTNESQKKEITLTIDNTEMKVVTDGNETVKTLDVPATLMNNRTMVPLRAISEALGCMVLWNGAEYSVSISYTKQITAEEFSQILQNIFNGSGDKEDKEEIPSKPEKDDQTSLAHNVTLVADKTNVKPGDVITVSVVLDKTQDICALGYKLNFTDEVFEIDTNINEEYYTLNEVELINAIDEDWYNEYTSLKSTEKWGDPVIGLDGNRIIFAAASANGISEKNSKSDFVIGKFTAKVSEDAKVGEYEITLEDATTADIGKYYGANMQFNALKIVVEK